MILRRYYWIVALACLTAIAFFLATGLSQLLGSALLGGPTVAAEPSLQKARPRIPPRIHHRKEARTILSRNIFDHAVGPLGGTAPESYLATSSEPGSSRPERCIGAMRLVSTAVADDADWSFAAINAAGKTLMYRVGGQVESSDVTRITWNAVFLRPSGGAECYIAMFEGAEAESTPARVATGPTSAPGTASAVSMTGNSELDSAIEAGVQKVSESEYNVDRSLVDRLLENQASLMRTARILPHEENGSVTGFKIYGVRRNSLLGKVGLQNGDIIHSINGYDMTSPDKALEAYARLRNADRLTVTVTRRGQRTNMDFNIR